MKSMVQLYQRDKREIALFRRYGLTWPFLLPLSVHQTLFPAVLQKRRH